MHNSSFRICAFVLFLSTKEMIIINIKCDACNIKLHKRTIHSEYLGAQLSTVTCHCISSKVIIKKESVQKWNIKFFPHSFFSTL